MSAVRSMTLADVAMPRAGWIVNTLLVIAASFVTAAAAQVEIRLPWTPVPVTGQTFAVLLTGAVLGTRRAFLAQMLYLAEGSMGLPVFSGTLVVKGQGRAVVTATGPRTEFGRIGQSLATLETSKTRLQEETGHFVKVVAIGAIATCVLLTAAYVAVRGEWLAGVLAGITLAMAVLPEEFPVILTVFLAIGAWRISRHDVLTRRMPAIETLGAATVLCVDKTGTLTQNRMQVVETIAAGDDLRLRDVAALACARDPFDPMERAIVEAAGASGEQLRRDWTLVREYPITPAFLAVLDVGLHGVLGGAAGRRDLE